MKRYWKRKWLAALRSGEYRQGRGALKQRERGIDQHCCLGVLCDLPADAKWTGSELSFSSNIAGGNFSLGEMGREYFGISPDDEAELIDMNDRGGKFTTIANWIEKNL